MPEWKKYVPVGERRANAEKDAARAGGKMSGIAPIQGRAIAKSFWGKSWCENLEAYSDYENRLPRGRSYVRNGSVVDLKIANGTVTSRVRGSSLYAITIGIAPLAAERWEAIVRECAGQLGSVVELLQGKLSPAVMIVVTRKETGLFPTPQQITLSCSCPDWASMCKHVAATLYGVGARLDASPELLFLLRGVNAEDLVTKAQFGAARERADERILEASSLEAIFGIELDFGPVAPAPKKGSRKDRPVGGR